MYEDGSGNAGTTDVPENDGSTPVVEQDTGVQPGKESSPDISPPSSEDTEFDLDAIERSVDEGLKKRKEEIEGWDLERKVEEAKKLDADPFVLETLLGWIDKEDPDRDSGDLIRLRVFLAHNPNTPQHVLRILARDGTDVDRLGVAHNQKAPADVLEMLARGDQHPDIQKGARTNPNAPASIAERPSDDETNPDQ